MRVLFIEDRPTGDWGMDLVFAGLVECLGPQNVFDFPAHEKHRRGIPVRTGDREKDWGAERGSLAYHHMYHDLPVLSPAEVTQKLREGFFDLIVVDELVQTYKRYLEVRGNFFDVPVVMVAGNDRFRTPAGPEAVRQAWYPKLKLAFLSNWRPEYDQLPYARPYSWSLNFDHLWNRTKQEKIYDICFMGLAVSQHRREILDHVDRMWGHRNNCIIDERSNNSFDRFLLKQEYFDRMAQSRICLNLRGDAECGKALRFYEIPYVGSYMLSQRFTNPDRPLFVPGFHCDFFGGPNDQDIDTMITWALDHPEEREKIARQGHEFVMLQHTCGVRVARMLNEIAEAR